MTDANDYRWQLEVAYTDDAEYQQALIRVLNIDDEGTHVARLDRLFEQTRDQEWMIDLCTAAAGQIMPEDPEYGQILLFSYDCFAHTHALLAAFFANRDSDMRRNADYIWLTDFYASQNHPQSEL